MKLKIKKDGLTGDNLKLYEDLEKRFEDLPDSANKESIELQIREAIKPFADLNVEKIKEMLGEDEKGFRAILKIQGSGYAQNSGNLKYVCIN